MMLDAAIAYARRGLPVFPIWPVVQFDDDRFACCCGKGLRCESPGKHPMARLVPHGLKDATTDAERVKHLWSCAPNANVGIATGLVVVLDVDRREALAELESKHGPLPETWRATTGNGEHVYFTSETEIRNSVGKIGGGLDIRGAGGYVVAPPSMHVSGKLYAWKIAPEQTSLAPLPAWLLAATHQLTSTKAATPVGTWRQVVKNGVGEGRRNDVITRLAGHLLRREVDPLVVFEMLLTWNAVRCRPPLEEGELAGIVARIAEREMRRRGDAT